MNENKIVCAIWMVTFNHESYINQSIESVLSQNTNFKFKLFIGDDKSTDRTAEICTSLRDRHPDKIDLEINSVNLGPNKNAQKIFKKCFDSGAKYVALLEGDDYWTDPYKLQKQVDFLEANEDYAICFHRVYELVEGKDPELSNLNISLQEESYTIEDLAKGNFIHTPSVVFRNGLIKKYPEWFCKSPVGDYPLHLLNAAHGKIKYLPEPLAVYRVGIGIWSSQTSQTNYNKWIILLDFLITHFDDEIVLNILLDQKLRIFKRLYELNDTLFTKKENLLYKKLMEEVGEKNIELEKLRIIVNRLETQHSEPSLNFFIKKFYLKLLGGIKLCKCH